MGNNLMFNSIASFEVRNTVEHFCNYPYSTTTWHDSYIIFFVIIQVYGIKGLSWLSIVPHFDIIQGTSIDYMHCVLLGVCRQLLKLWILSQYHKLPCYIGPKLHEIDDRLLLIRPPTEMQRTPRSIETTRKFWKGNIFCLNFYIRYFYFMYIYAAHELKAWLLHYSPVILKGILPTEYYQHYLLLVGVFLLLKDSVTSDDIKQSRLLLRHYCFMFSPLYGKVYCFVYT